MKKTISILLALVLVLALSATAFATDINSVAGNNTATQDVTAQVVSGTVGETATVYYVTITWNADRNTLKYTEAAAEYEWNPATLQYTGEGHEAGWSGDAQYTITVTNKSNAAVKAQASWQEKAGISAECSYNGDGSVTLGSAAVTEGSTEIKPSETGVTGTAQSNTIVATIGTPTDGTISAGENTVGTITVTITAAG